MINKIPDNWDYKDDLEMLFLFYQSTDELLSEVTTDTYALPLHNTLSLFLEIDEIYRLLKRNSIIEKYYEQYIPPIIEEFLKSLEDDYLLKKMLGKRQDLIKTGFTECLKNSILLERWLESFMQLCTLGRYKEAYENEIIHLVTQTNDKQKLLYCLSNYYVHLISIGYSREYIYICAKKYFDNKNKRIKSLTDIKGFLDIFSCQEEEYEFLVSL